MKRLLVLCAALFGIISCNDSTGPGAVSSLQVNFPTTSIPVGTTVQLSPAALDKNGNVLTNCVFTYSSSNQAVATITSDGLIAAVANGTTTITVGLGDKSSSAQITIGTGGSGAITSLSIVPVTTTIAKSQTGQLIAIALDGNGDPIPMGSKVAPLGAGVRQARIAKADATPSITVQWASDNTNVATVSNSGLVTGVNEGTATITAVGGGKTATATVIIVPASSSIETVEIVPPVITVGINSSAPLTAVALDASGNVLTGRAFTWASSNTTVATVDRNGVVRGIAAGNATITALSAGKTGTSAVTISSTGQGSITLAPNSVALAVGGTAQSAATVRDAAGNVVASPSVAFSTGNPAVATVTNTGAASATITGVAVGTTTFTAVSNGLSIVGNISVTGATVTTVTITPAAPVVRVNQSLQLTATARDGANNPIPGRAAVWNSSNPAVLAITSTGVVRGMSVGTSTVTATIDDVSTTKVITVQPAVIETVIITPAGPINLSVGGSVTVIAIAYDGAGNEVTGRKVNFTSSNESPRRVIVTDDDILLDRGIVTGSSVGDAVVTATVDGKSASVVVKVTLLPVNNIVVTPPSVLCVPLGSVVQVVGQVLDASGNVLTGRPISWTTSTPLLGAITNNGLLSALAPGVMSVTATVEGVVKTALVTVCPATAAQVNVSPSVMSLQPNGTQQITTTVLDALNAPIVGAEVSYSSSSIGVATVSNAGLVRGIAVGNATITVTSGGKSATVTVAVSNTPVGSVAASPSLVTLAPGLTQQLTPTTFDAQNNVLTGRSVTYTSSNPAVATVTPNGGLITAVALGTATITVSSEGKSSTVAVTVGNAPITSVLLEGPSLIVKLLWGSSSETFTATPKDALGNKLTGRACTLQSTNPNVLKVGLLQVTALGLGTSDITAVCEGVTSNVIRVSVVSVLGL